MTYDFGKFMGTPKFRQVVAKFVQRHPVQNETKKSHGITGPNMLAIPLNVRPKIPDVVSHTKRGDAWNLRSFETSVYVALFFDFWRVRSPVILDENDLLFQHVICRVALPNGER